MTVSLSSSSMVSWKIFPNELTYSILSHIDEMSCLGLARVSKIFEFLVYASLEERGVSLQTVKKIRAITIEKLKLEIQKAFSNVLSDDTSSSIEFSILKTENSYEVLKNENAVGLLKTFSFIWRENAKNFSLISDKRLIFSDIEKKFILFRINYLFYEIFKDCLKNAKGKFIHLDNILFATAKSLPCCLWGGGVSMILISLPAALWSACKSLTPPSYETLFSKGLDCLKAASQTITETSELLTYKTEIIDNCICYYDSQCIDNCINFMKGKAQEIIRDIQIENLACNQLNDLHVKFAEIKQINLEHKLYALQVAAVLIVTLTAILFSIGFFCNYLEKNEKYLKRLDEMEKR